MLRDEVYSRCRWRFEVQLAGQVNCLEARSTIPSGGEENPVQSAGPPEGVTQYRRQVRRSGRWSLKQFPTRSVPGKKYPARCSTPTLLVGGWN